MGGFGKIVNNYTWIGEIISSLPPICNPNFSFMGGFGKIVNNYTWIGEIIFRVTYTYLASLKIHI
jgi:hypothetical protein